MGKLITSLLYTILALLAVESLVSCGPKNAKPLAPAGIAAPGAGEGSPGQLPGLPSGPVSPGSPNAVTGTSDSGGGTGLDLKVFESYIQDPTQLPAFLQYVKPLLENIKSARPDSPARYDKIFRMKTWYFAPVDLQTIQKDILGISFVKSATQQMARQTMKQIWIDSRIYNKMKAKDQAELLVHEFVMSLYFLRFVEIDELCSQATILGEGSCSDVPESYKKSMKAEKLRPLNDEDNERIQFVTGWLLQNAQKPIAEIEFINVLAFKKFDHRFFNPEAYKPEHKSDTKMFPRKEILTALRAAALTGDLPEKCTSGDQNFDCKVQISETPNGMQGLTSVALKLSAAGKELFSIHSFFTTEISLTSNWNNVTSTAYWTLVLGDYQPDHKYKIGDPVSQTVIFLREVGTGDQKQLQVDSVTFTRGVIVDIDKTAKPVCKTMLLATDAKLDSAVIAHKKDTDSLLLQEGLLSVPPFAFCDANNVQE